MFRICGACSELYCGLASINLLDNPAAGGLGTGSKLSRIETLRESRKTDSEKKQIDHTAKHDVSTIFITAKMKSEKLTKHSATTITRYMVVLMQFTTK